MRNCKLNSIYIGEEEDVSHKVEGPMRSKLKGTEVAHCHEEDIPVDNY